VEVQAPQELVDHQELVEAPVLQGLVEALVLQVLQELAEAPVLQVHLVLVEVQVLPELVEAQVHQVLAGSQVLQQVKYTISTSQ